MTRHRLAVIIPTKDRPEELRRILGDIARQGDGLCQVIVVDGGETPPVSPVADFSYLPITYLTVRPPSLTAQRNAGIRALVPEATLAAFFDDDVVLEPNAIDAMLRFWNSAPDNLGGAGFNLTNEPYKKPTLFEKIFMVNADIPSQILKSGFQSKVSCVAQTTDVGWLPGCAMVWRRDLFPEFMFDERFSGYARYEEVDFSFRVGRRYTMVLVADARAEHRSRPENPDFSVPLGRMEVVNRFYFVSKNPDRLSRALCLWGLTGLLCNNIIQGIWRADRRRLLRAKGNLSGFFDLLLRKRRD